MTIPSDTMPPNEGVGLTPRQSIDIFVAIARFDERIGRLIDTLAEDRKARERDREEDRAEVAALKVTVEDLEKRLTTQETERIADKRSLDAWKAMGAGAFTLLAALLGADWIWSAKH